MKKIGKFLPTVFISIILLTSCQSDPFTSEDFTSRIFFNLWDFLAVFLAFIVLLLVAFFIAYKPIKKFIKNRGDYVENKIVEAESREEASRNLISEGEQYVKDSKKEAALIVSKARDDANKVKDEILEKAKEEANLEKEKARSEIAMEIEASKQAIHDEIVDVALTASEELLNREVSKEDNKRLLDELVNDLDKKSKK